MARHPIQILTLIAGLSILAGCGPSAVPADGPTRPRASYQALSQQEAVLSATWGAVPDVAPSALPGSGTARYSGVMALDTGTANGNLSMAGALDLTADFGAGRVTGSAQGFVDQAGRSYGGQLTLSNGQIDRTANPGLDPTFSADLDGTLSAGATGFTISADMHGNFKGPGPDAVIGTFSGVATGSSGPSYAFGSFVAQK